MILIYTKTNELIGGIERYIETQVDVFVKNGIAVTVYFENLIESEKTINLSPSVNIISKDELGTIGFSFVIIHKFDDEDLVSSLNDHQTTIAVVHDHEYYCRRGHKYFPNSKNCKLAYDKVNCSLCSCFGLSKKESFPYLYFKKDNVQKKISILKAMNGYVVISDYMKNNLLINGFKEEKIFLVKPFVDFKETHEGRRKGMLYVGQLIKGKGILKFLKNFNAEVESFSIIGDGKDRKNIENIASRWSGIKVLGFQNPENFYKNVAFLTFTSTWSEPFGLVGIEAMSWGLPVVAFNVGGVTDWLKHGENGFLVDEGDYETFNYYCDKLLNDVELANKMGNNAKSFVEGSFSKDNYIDNWLKVQGYCENRN